MTTQPQGAPQGGSGVKVGGVTVPPRVMGGGIIAILAIIFIAQNRNDVKINFLWLDINAPLWLWLTIMFVAGGVVGWIASRNRIRRKAMQKAAEG